MELLQILFSGLDRSTAGSSPGVRGRSTWWNTGWESR